VGFSSSNRIFALRKPMTELNDIITVAGMPGLYRILKPTTSGVLVESLNADKKRLVMSQNKPVSKLEDISIYTETDTVPLGDIFKKAEELFGKSLPVHPKSDDASLRTWMEQVLPEYDKERVYPSNIKKLVAWFEILSPLPDHAPAAESAE
jgi:hypothetical protein